ncbi:MAG: hypothetical protein K6C97_08790 [Treponema sp.]|nr:hypothetical protein [Treponema sp.]
MKKTILFFALSLFIFSGFAFAAPLESFLDQGNIDLLKKKGMISVVHPISENKLSLVPDSEYSSVIKSDIVKKNDKGIPFTAEFLYLIPKSKLLEKSSKTDITVDDLSIVLRSISKMQGMRYHFKEKKDGDVLYKISYTVDSLNSEKQIPDQTQGSADGKVLYCYQKDHTYGEIKYELNYHQNQDMVYVSFENTSPMAYVGFKAVEENKLHLNVMAIDCDDSVLLYLSTDVDAKKVPFINMRNKMEDSMTERMDALYRWFLVQF